MIPAMKKKTAVLFIDDDDNFLNDICDFLPPNNFYYKFNDPSKLITHVKKSLIFVPNHKPDVSMHSLPFTKPQSLFSDVSSFPFDRLVSVIVIDHRMEPVDGIEFCREINSRYVKRIMLTSYADQSMAINAFNSGLIDMFLLKTEANLIEKLTEAIDRCAEQFFIEISKHIDGYKSKINPFNNIELSTTFKDFCSNNKIIDFCFVHDFNQVIMKNKNNETKILNVFTDEDLDDLLSTEQACAADESIKQIIRERKLAPCFINESSPLIPHGSIWEKLMVPLKKVSDGIFIAHT